MAPARACMRATQHGGGRWMGVEKSRTRERKEWLVVQARAPVAVPAGADLGIEGAVDLVLTGQGARRRVNVGAIECGALLRLLRAPPPCASAQGDERWERTSSVPYMRARRSAIFADD